MQLCITHGGPAKDFVVPLDKFARSVDKEVSDGQDRSLLQSALMFSCDRLNNYKSEAKDIPDTEHIAATAIRLLAKGKSPAWFNFN